MNVGDYEIEVISGGRYRLDGGSMFGIIPRPLWERILKPDERNRIELDTCCLLVRTGEQNILIETGCGDKFSEKEQEIFAFESGVTIESSLENRGVPAEDIDLVILTHLHFDHAGGGTKLDASGRPAPTFPKATYVAHSGEWKDASENFGIMKTTYRPENLQPLDDSGNLQFIDGETEIAPGIRSIVTGGHTRHHLALLIESGGEKLFFTGDLIPTRHHLRGPYVMAYDLFPYDTMTQKLALLSRAESEGWYVVWSHEPHWRMARIQKTDWGEFTAEKIPS